MEDVTMHVEYVPTIFPLSDATIAKIEAHQAELDALLTPEAKARIDVIEQEFDRRMLGL